MKARVVVVLGAALLFAGCGGGESGGSDDPGQSDEAQIQALVDEYSQAALDGDTAAACETFSSGALETIAGFEEFDGCEDLIGEAFGNLDDAQKAELAEISNLEVDGETATAEGRDGTTTFIKEDGEWKQELQTPGS